MNDVQRSIDAVGFQARDRSDPARENPPQVVCGLARPVNPAGHVAIGGVTELQPAADRSFDRSLRVPWATFVDNVASVSWHRIRDGRYTTLLT